MKPRMLHKKQSRKTQKDGASGAWGWGEDKTQQRRSEALRTGPGGHRREEFGRSEEGTEKEHLLGEWEIKWSEISATVSEGEHRTWGPEGLKGQKMPGNTENE